MLCHINRCHFDAAEASRGNLESKRRNECHGGLQMSGVHLRDLPADQASDRETRLTLRLSPEARETLEWIARERHVSLAEAIRRALGTEKFLIEKGRRKARILVEEPGERTKELVLV